MPILMRETQRERDMTEREREYWRKSWKFSKELGEVWIRLIASTFCFQRISTFFFLVTVLVDFLSVNSVSVHCLRTHKFHFSATFSLKMGPTVLFTHLKINLLQYFQFSVFSFNKINSIQTMLKLLFEIWTIHVNVVGFQMCGGWDINV